MVKHLRAHDYVDATICERQSQRVAADCESEHRSARASKLECRIQADGRELDTDLCGNVASAAGDVAKTGTDIEEGRRSWRALERFLELVQRGAQATKQGVGANYIGE